MLQPFPKFYIIRPDDSLTPLIPADELPKWVSFANWDPEDIAMYSNMYAATLTTVPREGEYDLVCHHCISQVDGHHRSVSEQSDLGVSIPTAALTYRDAIGMPDSCSMQAPDPAPCQLTTVPILPSFLKQPPFHANLYSPFVGMCFINFGRWPWPFRSRSVAQAKDHTEEAEEERPEETSSHHSNHHSSDADDESDGAEPARTPLLQGMDIRRPRSNPSDNRLPKDNRPPQYSSSEVDLELGLGQSVPFDHHFISELPTESSLSAGGSTVNLRRPKTAEDAPPKKSALARKAVGSKQGTKKVRFNSFMAESTGVRSI